VHSDRLQALVPQATLARIAGAAHNDLQDFDAHLDVYAKALAKP
jgi:hypothetical protein